MKTAEDLEYFNSMWRHLDRMIKIANNLSGNKNNKLFYIQMLLSNHQVINNHHKTSLTLIRLIDQLSTKLLQNFQKIDLNKNHLWLIKRKLILRKK